MQARTARVSDVGAIRRAARGPVAIGAVVVTVAVLIALLADRPAPGYLDPAAPNDEGSRAAAALLRDLGVTVDEARLAAEVPAGADVTVLVPFPAQLAPAQLVALRASDADVVLVAPDVEVLDALAPGVELIARGEPVEVREPGCALPSATRAGAVSLGGSLYRGDRALACYPAEDGAALLQVTDGERTITVLGSADILLNQSLAEEGNAALMLALLGADPRLVWFRPGPESPAPGAARSLVELVPAGWWWASAQLVVAVVLLAGWRMRRLGPVVTEPLPVVVRSAEAAEGRARLYRRAGARDHAAEVLRGAARARLAPLLGVPATAGPDALVLAVSARGGRPIAEVSALLYGAAPTTDDAGLIALVDALDRCESEVRRS
jgi:hypothetical protein